MTVLASLVAAHAAYLGIVIASGEDHAFTVLECESLEIGHLEALEEKVEGKDKRRIIGDDEIAELNARVTALLRAHGVTQVLIESPSVKSLLGSRVFVAVRDHLQAEGIEHQAIFSVWRNRFGESFQYRNKARELATHLFGSSDTFTYDSTIFAAALMAHVDLMEVVPPEKHPELRQAQRTARQKARQVALSQAPQPPPSVEPDLAPELLASLEQLKTIAEVPPANDTPPGAVIGGCDSGSGYVGLVIGRGDSTPLRLLHIETFELGEDVPLKKPRVFLSANDESYTITTKRVLTLDHVGAVADAIVAKLVEHKVTLFVIEYMDAVHIDKDSASSASAIATHLLKTTWVWLTTYERARAAGIRCELVKAATWRAKVAGRIAGQVGGEGVALIPQAVKSGFDNWPEGDKSTNEHERDAAGCVLYGCILLQPSEIKAKAVAVEKKRRGPRKLKPGEVSRKAEREAIKLAAGCTCKTRHVGSCKLARVPVAYSHLIAGAPVDKYSSTPK